MAKPNYLKIKNISESVLQNSDLRKALSFWQIGSTYIKGGRKTMMVFPVRNGYKKYVVILIHDQKAGVRGKTIEN